MKIPLQALPKGKFDILIGGGKGTVSILGLRFWGPVTFREEPRKTLKETKVFQWGNAAEASVSFEAFH